MLLLAADSQASVLRCLMSAAGGHFGGQSQAAAGREAGAMAAIGEIPVARGGVRAWSEPLPGRAGRDGSGVPGAPEARVGCAARHWLVWQSCIG
jgi:hypothetical protein